MVLSLRHCSKVKKAVLDTEIDPASKSVDNMKPPAAWMDFMGLGDKGMGSAWKKDGKLLPPIKVEGDAQPTTGWSQKGVTTTP